MSFPVGKTRLDLTLNDDRRGRKRSTEHRTVEIPDHPDADELHRIFHVLHTELRVTPGDQALPRQNERARAWLKFSGKRRANEMAVAEAQTASAHAVSVQYWYSDDREAKEWILESAEML